MKYSILSYIQRLFLRSFEEPKTLLLALSPSTLFKIDGQIDKIAAFSVLSTGTIRLLQISILGASAGTIRAVPDTVKKVPGLAPVLFWYKTSFFRKPTNDFKLKNHLINSSESLNGFHF